MTSVKLPVLLALLGLLLLASCQRQRQRPDVAISSGQAVYAGTFSLEPAVTLTPAQGLVHVVNVEDDHMIVAFVSDKPLEGVLFTTSASTQVVASEVVTADFAMQTGTLTTAATVDTVDSLPVSNQQTSTQQANTQQASTQQASTQTVTHALEASFVDASLGDLDGNGFTLVDIVKLLNIVVGNSTPANAFAAYHADVTCDNVVNISDVLFVLRKFVGIEQAIPMCPLNLSLASGEAQIILFGNPMMAALTAVNVVLDVPAGMTVTDVSSSNAFGIALRVSATQSGVAFVTVGGETVRVEVNVVSTPTPTSTTISLRLVAADTQENAAVTGLPLTGAPLVISP